MQYLLLLSLTCRTGRYLLQSSPSIIESSALLESEDALNQGSTNAAEVFISLRSKSILHLFASISRFLGLEVKHFLKPFVTVTRFSILGVTKFIHGSTGYL